MTEKYSIVQYTEDSYFSLEDVCAHGCASRELIYDLISFAVLHPKGKLEKEWQFDAAELQKIKTAARLQRDLEINAAGIAVVLDLIHELELLRAKAEFLEKHMVR